MMKSLFKLIPILSLLASVMIASASAQTTTNAKNNKWEAGSNIIVKNFNVKGKTLDQLIQQITLDFYVTQGLCKINSRFANAGLIASCLVGTTENNFSGAIKPYIQYALKNDKIDKVEALALTLALSAVYEVRGTTIDGIILGNMQMEAPRGKNIPLPSLLAYRQNKLAFATLRKNKEREEILPKDVLEQMAKKFPREINGVGNVTAEQFFAAQMGRLQLNSLAGVMVSATDFMARPNARVVLYPVNYSFNNAQLKILQEKEIELANLILDEEDETARANMQAELSQLLAESKKYRQKDQVDELIAQREIKTEELQNELLQLATLPLNDKVARADIKRSFLLAVNTLNTIDQKIADLIKIEELPPADLQRFVMNVLNSDFRALMEQNNFKGLNLRVADTLLAAWIAGDISSEALVSMSQLASMKEVHTSVWKKALSVGWTIGKTALMAFPTTAYIAIGISIFENVNKTLDAQKEQKSNETHLIPNN